MLERLKEIEERYEQLSGLLADPEVLRDPAKYTNFAREHSSLEEFVIPYARLKQVLETISENESMMDDPDPGIRSLARDELAVLREEKERIEAQLKALFIPRDPMTPGTSFWRSARVRVETRQPFSPRTSSACTRGMPRKNGGS